MSSQMYWRPRLQAAAIHLLISLAVASLAAVLVFAVWYPGAYREFAGGRGLFFLITGADVVLGPLLTFVVYNRTKGWPELRFDLAVIGFVQLVALTYGLHTTFEVRPVATVFEVDRFRVVSDLDVQRDELPMAPEQLRSISVTGPRLLGARLPEDADERKDALLSGLKGIDVGVRPKFWTPYDAVRARALMRSRPVSLLLERYEGRRDELEHHLRDAHLSSTDARFLPLMARGDWVVLMTPEGDVAGFAPFDGFF